MRPKTPPCTPRAHPPCVTHATCSPGASRPSDAPLDAAALEAGVISSTEYIRAAMVPSAVSGVQVCKSCVNGTLSDDGSACKTSVDSLRFVFSSNTHNSIFISK